MSFKELRDFDTNTSIHVYTKDGSEKETPKGMPDSLIIYGMHYSIKYHTHIFNSPKKNQRLRGVVIYAHRLILIDPNQSIHDMRETLYHEVSHVYLKAKCTQSLSKLTDQQTEDLCDLFGEAIYDLVANNLICC